MMMMMMITIVDGDVDSAYAESERLVDEAGGEATTRSSACVGAEPLLL